MIYITLFLLSFLLTYFMKNYAIKKSLLASINERSSHKIPTPHGGGVAIALSWFFGLFYLYFNDSIEPRLFYALLCGFIVAIVGFFDDIYELNPKIRLFFQLLSATLGLLFLGGLDNIDLGFFEIENRVITTSFALLLIIWYINLYNFIDGINGYAGSEALFLSIAGFLLFGEDFFVIFGLSVLGFLYWNFGKAEIFMGDVGSTLLGYSVAIFTIYYANLEATNLWVWIALFSLFWFDATYTLLRRFLNKERLFKAHRKHLYQRASRLLSSHSKVVLLGMGYNLALLFTLLKGRDLVFFVLSFLVIITYLIEKKKPFTND